MDADTLRLILIVVGTALVLALYLWERSRADDADDEQLPLSSPSPDKREPTVGTLDTLGEVAPSTPAAELTDPQAPAEAATDSKGRRQAAEVASLQAASRRAASVPQAALHLVADASEPDPDAPGGANTLVLQLGVRVRGAEMNGPDLLDVAARCGLRPGELGAFHHRVLAGAEQGTRHSDNAPSVEEDGDDLRTLFSMASMVKPGEFPFDAMEEFHTPGVILYAVLHRGADNLTVLDEMTAAARRLADEFDAEVLDERRAPLTAIMVDVLRARVREFDRALRPGRQP
jgi:cell division protein ZipA